MNKFLRYTFVVISIVAILFVIHTFWGWPGLVSNLFAFFGGGYLTYLHCNKQVVKEENADKLEE